MKRRRKNSWKNFINNSTQVELITISLRQEGESQRLRSWKSRMLLMN